MARPRKEIKELDAVINFRIPSNLKDAIGKAAAKDDRTIAQWLRVMAEKALGLRHD